MRSTTRRRLLELAAAFASAARVRASPAGPAVDYYDKLGVAKIINAAGTYTILTASTMPPPVRAAVAQAALHPVRLLELQQKAGEYLAKRLKCEAALVTAGASSALTLGIAACLGVMNDAPVESVPMHVAQMRRYEVIIQKAHRYGYDHAIENCGVRFVECSRSAITSAPSRTALRWRISTTPPKAARSAAKIGCAWRACAPTFNDAAADMPPIANLWNYTQMGFDLVTFSGGKGIRGPQNAGLLLGRKDLIAAAVATNNPHDEGVGQGMKVAKEQIVGMVAAVDWLLERSDDAMQAEFRRRAERIAAHLESIPSLQAKIVVPPVANHVPHLLLRYDSSRVKISPLEVAARLRNGSPSIELNPATGRRQSSAGLPSDENTIVVDVWMLEPGEDRIVARRLRKVLVAANAA